MKEVCNYPFKAFAVLPSGNAGPCCAFHGQFQRIDSIKDLNSYFGAGDDFSTLRTLELTNNWHSGCMTCKRQEDANITSRKTSFKKNFNSLDNNDSIETQKLILLDLSFGNTCNLSCAMCYSEFSSKWTAMDNLLDKDWRPKYPINSLSFDDVDKIIELIKSNRSTLKLVEIKGGEPLYDKKFHYFLNMIQTIDHDFTLRLITNFTTIDQTMCDKLNSVANLELTLSIDGINEMYTWIRGFDFNITRDKIETFLPKFRNSSITVNYTTSIYNLNHLLPFSDWLNQWCDQHDMAVELNFHTFVRHPAYLSPRLADNKEESLRQIEILRNRNNSATIISSSLDALESYLRNTAKIEEKTKNHFREFHEFLVKQRGFDILCI